MEPQLCHHFQYLCQHWCSIYWFLICCIIKNWSIIWYHLTGKSYYTIAVSLDVKVISFIKIIFKFTFVKHWNLCIITVVLDIMFKERTVYLKRNCNFIIKLMKKYKIICSYFYWKNSVQRFYVDVFVNQIGTEMLFYFWKF